MAPSGKTETLQAEEVLGTLFVVQTLGLQL